MKRVIVALYPNILILRELSTDTHGALIDGLNEEFTDSFVFPGGGI
jgi:hypothetical protein